MLQLENKSRVPPGDIPRNNMRAFKLWSDYACVEWPAELTIEAFLAWEDIHVRNDPTRLARFLKSYERWWAFPEGEKINRMAQCQIDSPSRTFSLHRARQTVAHLDAIPADGVCTVDISRCPTLLAETNGDHRA